jgi:hypothetical protein
VLAERGFGRVTPNSPRSRAQPLQLGDRVLLDPPPFMATQSSFHSGSQVAQIAGLCDEADYRTDPGDLSFRDAREDENGQSR